MATVIGVMGESGSGKTTSLRNLDPSTTYIIDCDGKGLCWRGWKAHYNKENRNYSKADTQKQVLDYIKYANDNMPNVKVVVVDTINGIMVEEERLHKDEKGYDKWSDLAWNVWNIVLYGNKTMRDDMTLVLCAHSETIDNDNGQRFTRILTNGRKLNKLKLESKMRAVLHCYRDDDGNYVFGVHSRDSITKTPFGLYDDVESIPNDLAKVIDDIRKFDSGCDADD